MKALIVDDSRAIRSIIKRILVEAGITEIHEAGDGAEALSIFEAFAPFDLALVDWNMPVMDGLTFVRMVRTKPGAEALCIMMVTTENEQSQVVRALAAGANEYLTKPFLKEGMLEKLDLLGFRCNP